VQPQIDVILDSKTMVMEESKRLLALPNSPGSSFGYNVLVILWAFSCARQNRVMAAAALADLPGRGSPVCSAKDRY
jgi:hypothetical protein